MYLSFPTDTTSVLPWMSLCKITINECLNYYIVQTKQMSTCSVNIQFKSTYYQVQRPGFRNIFRNKTMNDCMND